MQAKHSKRFNATWRFCRWFEQERNFKEPKIDFVIEINIFELCKRPVKVPLETNSHCITCPTITERISERSNFDLLIDAESLPNENPLNDNLDSDTGFSKFHSRALTATVKASQSACKL